MKCDGCTHAERCPAKEEHGGAKRCSAFKPLTEQEYIQTCNTEQLAECLARYFYGWTTNSAPYDIVLHSVMEWLKQPHQMTTK